MKLLRPFCIGFLTGLRMLTPAAGVAWAARQGRLRPPGRLSLAGRRVVVAMLSLGAFGELTGDKLPQAPARTSLPSLTARTAMGGFLGACLSPAGGRTAFLCAAAGALGGVAGSFGGYQARKQLTSRLEISDLPVAVLEDCVAIGGTAALLAGARSAGSSDTGD